MSSVIFYSPCCLKLNGHLLLSLVLEHSPGWIIDESRKEWILEAIKTRDFNFLRLLVETIQPFDQAAGCIEAAAGIENNGRIMEYLVSRDYPIDHFKTMFSAVENRALNNLKLLATNGFPIENTYVFHRAASTENNIPILEYLLPLDRDSSQRLRPLYYVVRSGAVNNMKWLLKNGFALEKSEIVEDAILSDSLEMLNCLKANGCPLPQELSFHSRLHWNRRRPRPKSCCSVETLEWLAEHGVSMVDDAPYLVLAAAREGCFDKMQWLFKHGCPLVSPPRGQRLFCIKVFGVLAAAAGHGSLRNMKWLFKNGCPIEYSEIMIQAAIHGSLINMKWLLKNGCPTSNSAILVEAARKGNLKNMQWLFKNGCPINDSKIFRAAAELGSIRQMEWLLENGCPIDDPLIFAEAANKGNMETMQWLLQKGCPINDSRILNRAAAHGSLANIIWLLGKGCPRDDIMAGAVEYGSLYNMKWLWGHGCSINNNSHILSKAAGRGSLVNMKWLFENGWLINSKAFESARESLAKVKWLLQHGCLIDPATVFEDREMIYDGSFSNLWNRHIDDPSISINFVQHEQPAEIEIL